MIQALDSHAFVLTIRISSSEFVEARMRWGSGARRDGASKKPLLGIRVVSQGR